jgi:hypothetical protein
MFILEIIDYIHLIWTYLSLVEVKYYSIILKIHDNDRIGKNRPNFILKIEVSSSVSATNMPTLL